MHILNNLDKIKKLDQSEKKISQFIEEQNDRLDED